MEPEHSVGPQCVGRPCRDPALPLLIFSRWSLLHIQLLPPRRPPAAGRMGLEGPSPLACLPSCPRLPFLGKEWQRKGNRSPFPSPFNS